MLLLSLRLMATDAASPLAKPVEFDTYDGYFVSNQFEPKAATSFVVLKDQAAFDKVFGVGMVMRDKHHRLPAAAFDDKIVVAAIHRGKAMVTYKVDSVAAEGPALIVTYTTQVKPSETAEFSCPLIISVPKADYHAVRFLENGKQVKRLELVAAPAPAKGEKPKPAADEGDKTSKAPWNTPIPGQGQGQFGMLPQNKQPK